MIRKPETAPDWGRLIRELMGDGMSANEIAGAMGYGCMTDNMVRKYLSGTIQPMYHRGVGLVGLWVTRFQRTHDDVPQAAVIRGHRAQRRTASGPRVQALINWPPVQVSPAPSVSSIKPKRGRKAKAAEATEAT